MRWLLGWYQQRPCLRKDPFQLCELTKVLFRLSEKKRPKCYFLLGLVIMKWMLWDQMFLSLSASLLGFPTVDGQRFSQSSHNSLFFCESQVKVPTRCSSQRSPCCFCLGLCWSSVWGAFPDTICLRNGFQRMVFWSDPPVRAPPPPQNPRWSQHSVGLPRLPRE